MRVRVRVGVRVRVRATRPAPSMAVNESASMYSHDEGRLCKARLTRVSSRPVWGLLV